MSKDDTDPQSTAQAVPSLPDASHRNVVLTLHAVRTADRGSRITDHWLRLEHGVGQDKQSARLLRFLQITDTRKKLKEDVLSTRENWERFRQLLVERVRQGCERIGLEHNQVAHFGSGSWDAFQDALVRSTAIASRTDRSQANIVACFRAMANICEMDEETFEAELGRVSSPTNRGRNGAINRNDAGGVTGEQQCAFPIGGLGQGKMVYARISFSEPVQPGDFRRVAEILKAMDVPMQAPEERQ